MRLSKNRIIRGVASRYEVFRKNFALLLGRVIGRSVSMLPRRLAASVKQEIKIKAIRIPYSKTAYMSVNSTLDISRSRFPFAEPSTVEWIEKQFRQGDIFYDVGANLGAVSLIAATFLDQRCKIYAFEPVPSTFSTLVQNVMHNNFGDTISTFMIPLSDQSRIDSFFYSSLVSGSSAHSLSGSATGGRRTFEQTVISWTIDDLHKKFGFDYPNHLKIDVDGHDFEVLLGATEAFESGKIKSVLVEKNNKETLIRQFLKERGFNEFPVEEDENILFIKPEAAVKTEYS